MPLFEREFPCLLRPGLRALNSGSSEQGDGGSDPVLKWESELRGSIPTASIMVGDRRGSLPLPPLDTVRLGPKERRRCSNGDVGVGFRMVASGSKVKSFDAPRSMDPRQRGF